MPGTVRYFKNPVIWLVASAAVAVLAALSLIYLIQAEAGPHRDVDFVPTPPEVVDKMLELAEVKKSDVVYDLGCGDGRIVIAAAKKYRCRAVGFDIDPVQVEESLANVRKNGVSALVEIGQADIFSLDLSGADVIALYLLPNLNARLLPQLEKLKPGSRIVSHAWGMSGVKPKKITRVKTAEGRERTVYLWATPLAKE